MRLSRDRRWGDPALVSYIEALSQSAAQDGWAGLLVGDMGQARGGPMASGHASHQIGLDVDLWLIPMPGHTLSDSERENLSATSVLKPGTRQIDPKLFGEAQRHADLSRRDAPRRRAHLRRPRHQARRSATSTGATAVSSAPCAPGTATTTTSTCA